MAVGENVAIGNTPRPTPSLRPACRELLPAEGAEDIRVCLENLWLASEWQEARRCILTSGDGSGGLRVARSAQISPRPTPTTSCPWLCSEHSPPLFPSAALPFEHEGQPGTTVLCAPQSVRTLVLCCSQQCATFPCCVVPATLGTTQRKTIVVR